MSQLRETAKEKRKKDCVFYSSLWLLPCHHSPECLPSWEGSEEEQPHTLPGRTRPGNSFWAEQWGRKPRPSSSTSFWAALTFLFSEWEDSRFQPCLHRGGVFSCLKFCEWRHLENRNTKNNLNCHSSIQVSRQRYHNTITQIHFHQQTMSWKSLWI